MCIDFCVLDFVPTFDWVYGLLAIKNNKIYEKVGVIMMI